MLGYGNPYLRSLFWTILPRLKDLLTSIYGYRRRHEIFGKYYHKYYEFLKRSQYYSNDKLRKYQEDQVKKFIAFAVSNVPYYQKLFSQHNLSINDIKSIEDVALLPILDKETFRQYSQQMVAGPFREKKSLIVEVHTSGTTGKGLHLIVSKEAWQREYAFRYLHLSWAGIYPGMRMAIIAGHPVINPHQFKPPFWTIDYYNNTIYFSSQHFFKKTLPMYIKRLKSFSPELIRGYPSSVHILAEATMEMGEKDIRPKAVFMNSETLLDYQRRDIEQAFSCKVYNWYGNAEQVANIVECEKGKLHVKSEHSLVEFLKQDGSPAKQGELGEMICTSFGNYAMPLIRYRIGDLAELSHHPCDCGRGGQIVERIIGRVEDIIVTPTGRHVGRLDHLFKDMINVKEAQIIQDKLDSITIRIVKRPGFGNKDMRILQEEVRVRLGNDIDINYEFVEELARDSSGKLRFVVCNISKHSENSPLPISTEYFYYPTIYKRRSIEDNVYKMLPSYKKMPDWIKRLLYTPFKAFPRELLVGKVYRMFYEEAKMLEFASKKRIEEYQYLKIKSLLWHCYNTVPFYQHKWREYGIDIQKIQSLDDFQKIVPYITKQMIQDNAESLISTSYKLSESLPKNTSGSTGTPLCLCYLKGFTRAAELAHMHVQWERVGYNIRGNIAILRGEYIGKKRLYTYDPWRNAIIFNSFLLNTHNANYYLKILEYREIKYINAFPSTLSNLINLSKLKEKIIPSLEVIFLSSENIFEWQADLFKSFFKIDKIFYWYGHTECCALGGGCEISNIYHFFPSYSYVEFIPAEINADEMAKECYEIVGTSFINPLMPLVRHKTDDYGSIGNCECHREHKQLDKVYGRKQEIAVGYNGERISLTALISARHGNYLSHIKDMQIVNSEPGKLTVKVIPKESFDKQHYGEIIENLSSKQGIPFETKVVLVDSIETTEMGKHQFLIREFDLGN